MIERDIKCFKSITCCVVLVHNLFNLIKRKLFQGFPDLRKFEYWEVDEETINVSLAAVDERPPPYQNLSPASNDQIIINWTKKLQDKGWILLTSFAELNFTSVSGLTSMNSEYPPMRF